MTEKKLAKLEARRVKLMAEEELIRSGQLSAPHKKQELAVLRLKWQALQAEIATTI